MGAPLLALTSSIFAAPMPIVSFVFGDLLIAGLGNGPRLRMVLASGLLWLGLEAILGV